MRSILLACVALTLAAGAAGAAVVSSTTHAESSTGLDHLMSGTDLIAGMLPTEEVGGWHPANTDPADKLPAFTDGIGMRGTGLTGLLNDFPAPGSPAKEVLYDLDGAKDIAAINIFTGNNGQDGRIFSTTVVLYSTDNGASFETLGYFQSDPSGTLNNVSSDPRYGSTLVSIIDDASSTLLAGVTHVRFNLYGVDNTNGQMRDPFDGVNPFTGVDDGLNAPNTSPLVLELDVIAVPEPASLVLLSLGGLALIRRRRA